MKKIQLLLAAVLISLVGYSQEDTTNEYQNSGNKLLNDSYFSDVARSLRQL